MLYRNKKPNDVHQGKWNGLGGKLESGESPEECAVREIREESGLDARDPEFRGILTFPRFDGTNDWLVFVYVIRHFSGTLIDSPEGHLEWIPDSEILKLQLWEGDRIFLPWVMQNKFFSGKFEYQDSSLENHSVVFHDFINDPIPGSADTRLSR